MRARRAAARARKAIRPKLGAVTALCLALSLAALVFDATPVLGAGLLDVSWPREVSSAERQAVALAILYLEEGAASWWDQLAPEAPLRQLGQQQAIDEIAVRCGPRQDAIWTLQTVPESRLGSFEEVRVIFAIEYPSGLDEILELILVQEGEWKIRRILSLVEERKALPRSTDKFLPMASLLPLRRALARGGGDANLSGGHAVSGSLGEVDRLWRAQFLLVQRRLAEAQALLTGHLMAETRWRRPLASLLAARLAQLKSNGAKASTAYERVLEMVPDHDGIRLEAMYSLMMLGINNRVSFSFGGLSKMGSRQADVYYFLAILAVQDGDQELAEHCFTTAWELKPRERKEIFSSPLFAFLAIRPGALPLIQLGSAEEPVMRPRGSRKPLAALGEHDARLLGRRLAIEVRSKASIHGRASAQGKTTTGHVMVPGGATLAPPATPQENAATVARREERQALAALEKGGAGAVGVSPRRLQTIVVALARDHQWKKLARLTDHLGNEIDTVSPEVAHGRARALLETGRESDAQRLLIRLARNNIANKRPDPMPFYHLGELMASSGEYELAIRLIEKALRLIPYQISDARIRQLRMEQKLTKSYLTYDTTHFDIRYPRETGRQYPEDVGLVLEAEFERLRAWIPVRTDVRIGIDLFPVGEFMASYSQGLAVLGVYDGRVRLPFAQLRSLHPELVSVLSHELAHAMIAEHTGDRVPKWLHEGLAQHIEMVQPSVNPLPDLLKAKRVLSFSLLEPVLAGFGEAQLVGLAYNEAAWVLHFVEARYGVPGIHRLLKGFADGHDTEGALRQAFNISAARFEAAAWQWGRDEAPDIWPVELRRYDKELSPHLQRAGGIGASRAEKPVARVGRRTDLPIGSSPIPPPPGPSPAEVKMEKEMKTWHAAYAQRVLSIRVALGPVVRAFSSTERPDGLLVLCRDLADLVLKLLAEPQVFRSPDDSLAGFYLQRAYRGFGEMGRSCVQGHSAQVRVELEKARRELQKAARILAPYGLKP